MKLSIIAAIASNGVIGLNNSIPWALPEDMKYFKNTTMSHRIIMGRKTCFSLNKPLTGRQNVMVSTQFPAMRYKGGETEIVNSIEEALALPQWGEHEEVFCIGGAQLYEGMLPLAAKLYLTEIYQEVEGDIYFPQWDRREWSLTSTQPMTNDHFMFSFNIYERI